MNRIIETFFNERPDISEKNDLRIFINLSLVDSENVLAILPQIPHIKDIHVVLVFDEIEINDNSDSILELTHFFNMYHKWGFELALLFKDKYFHLDSNFYKNFDFFEIDARIAEGIKKNQRTRLNIHGLVEQILHYKKPIIATDVKDKQSIELIIKSGITYVSADDICGTNDNLLPIEKKKMDKLVELHKN